MYSNVQLTQSEIELLGRIVSKYTADYPEDEQNNVHILLRLLRRNYAGDWESFLGLHEIND